MMSLRQRLLFTLGVILLGVWLLVTLAVVLTTRHEMGLLADAQLVQGARSLATIPAVAGQPRSAPTQGAMEARLVPVIHQEWSATGRLLGHSAGAPETPLAEGAPGFGEVERAGIAWRYFSMRTAAGHTLVVASRGSDRRQRMLAALTTALAPMFMAVPLTAMGLWSGVSICLRPLALLSGEIAKRDVGHLEPLGVRGVPAEIRPLVAELNSMLGRLDEAFSRFDRFAADAAHELRAPVTAIRTQAEAGLAGAGDDERRQALEQVLRSADSCGLLVEQILLMARLETEDELLLNGELELAELARDVMRDMAPKALVKGLDLSFDARGPLYVYGNEELMRVLIRNLLENAIRCTPAGGRVQLRLGHDAGGLQLHVEDSGPGIPSRERSQVLQRFCRLPDAVGLGYGIGLSIVERIAKVHRARVLLQDGSEGKGLRVCIHFAA